jgi:hypothetical protein
MTKTYCNRHYGFYENHEGCNYCVPVPKEPATPLPQGEIVYAGSLHELVDLGLSLVYKKVYLNAWTWDSFLTGPGHEWVDRDWLRRNGHLGSLLGVDVYLHDGLHNREVRVVPL